MKNMEKEARKKQPVETNLSKSLDFVLLCIVNDVSSNLTVISIHYLLLTGLKNNGVQHTSCICLYFFPSTPFGSN